MGKGMTEDSIVLPGVLPCSAPVGGRDGDWGPRG